MWPTRPATLPTMFPILNIPRKRPLSEIRQEFVSKGLRLFCQRRRRLTLIWSCGTARSTPFGSFSQNDYFLRILDFLTSRWPIWPSTAHNCSNGVIW